MAQDCSRDCKDHCENRARHGVIGGKNGLDRSGPHFPLAARHVEQALVPPIPAFAAVGREQFAGVQRLGGLVEVPAPLRKRGRPCPGIPPRRSAAVRFESTEARIPMARGRALMALSAAATGKRNTRLAGGRTVAARTWASSAADAICPDGRRMDCRHRHRPSPAERRRRSAVPVRANRVAELGYGIYLKVASRTRSIPRSRACAPVQLFREMYGGGVEPFGRPVSAVRAGGRQALRASSGRGRVQRRNACRFPATELTRPSAEAQARGVRA